MARPLGDTQRHVLWSMISHDRTGVWYPGSGWYWTNISTTVRIMKSLERRGLVSARDRFTSQGGRKVRYIQYTITDEGRKQAGSPDVLPARTRR